MSQHTNSHPVSQKYPILRFIIWFITVAGIIVICIYGVEESKRLINDLDEVSWSALALSLMVNIVL